jgi:hypothetical protein
MVLLRLGFSGIPAAGGGIFLPVPSSYAGLLRKTSCEPESLNRHLHCCRNDTIGPLAAAVMLLALSFFVPVTRMRVK